MRPFQNLVRILDSQPSIIKPRTRGQSLVELAITAPLLFLMIVSMAEIAYVANNYLVLVDAVRQGARFAVSASPLNWNDGDTRNLLRTACFQQTTAQSNAPPLPPWGPSGFYDPLQNEPEQGTSYPNLGSTPQTSLQYWVPDSNNYTLWPAPNAPKGLFDGVACNTIASMQPLTFDVKYNWPLGQNGPNINYDDIAVSVVSYVVVPPGSINPPAGQVTITGRWPISNRECGSGTLTNGIPNATFGSSGPESDTRDPFEYTSTSPLPYPYSHYATGFGSVRGFILTGNMYATNSSGNVDTTCYGSSFTVGGADPKRDLNAILNDKSTLTDPSLQPYVTNGAMAIVEATWTHHQLFGFPPFNLLGSPTLYVWSVFPVSAAIPTPTPPPNQPPGQFSLAPMFKLG